MTLQLYLLRQLLVATCFGAGGLLFIAIPAAGVSAIHAIGGVAMETVLGFLALILTDLVPYLLPLGFLLAVVATYGRLAADNEWTAIAMAGIHPLRMLLPALGLAVVLASATYWLSTEVQPGLTFAKREYLKKSLVTSFCELNPGRTELPFSKFYLSSQFREGNTFRDVLIQLPSRSDGGDSEQERTILAESATVSFTGRVMSIALVDARTVDGRQDVSVGRLTATIDLDQLFRTAPVDANHWKYLSSPRLRSRLAHDEVPARDVRRATYEVHRRDTVAAIYFLFILLGAPTGILLKRGTQLGALSVSVGYALADYLLSMSLGEPLAEGGSVSPVLAAWFTPFCGLVAGLILSWKAFRR